MSKWIERGLYKMFGWWRWKRRFSKITQYSLNAFCGQKLRVLVSEPDRRGLHTIHVERQGRDEQWRRIGAIEEEEFSELMALLVDAGNFIRPGTLRWRVIPR